MDGTVIFLVKPLFPGGVQHMLNPIFLMEHMLNPWYLVSYLTTWGFF